MAGPIARRQRPGRTRRIRAMRTPDEWAQFWRHLGRGWPATRHLKKPQPAPGSWWSGLFRRRREHN